MSSSLPIPYVSRGGLKLVAALDAFAIDPTGCTCADLGCNVGGFTDCLLQLGATKVFSVDTAYGQLAWKLRSDPRVATHERTNALHFDPAAIPAFEGCDLVVMDLGWSRQQLAVPAAMKWLQDGENARIITLIKPHYESTWKQAGQGEKRGVLTDEESKQVCDTTLGQMDSLGAEVLGCIESPIRGGGSRGREGNIEYLALLQRSVTTL